MTVAKRNTAIRMLLYYFIARLIAGIGAGTSARAIPGALAALLVLALATALAPAAAWAATVTIACGAVGIEYRLCREGSQAWARANGHQVRLVQTPNLTNERLGLFQQMLSTGSADIDVFQIDVIWPGMLGRHFVDLRQYIEPAEIAAHYPALIRNNTVDGELKAMPWFTDVGLLYYRKDLLKAHGLKVPTTWAELVAAGRKVIAAQQAAGNSRFSGFVFQGKAFNSPPVPRISMCSKLM